MAEQPELRSLKEGDVFNGHLLAQEVSFKTSAKGSEYLEMKLADASGDLKAFLWDLRAIEGDMDKVAADAFLKVKGQISIYNGRTQMRLDKVRFAQDAEVGDFSRFFPTSKRPLAEMVQELDATIAGVGDPWIRRLLELIFIEEPLLREAFCKAPAAKSMHHVYLGGLIEHTLSVLGLAERACAHYQELNRDLVVAGVLLHDVGKTAELTYVRSFGYSDAGNLIGHISMEADWINRAVARIPDFPEELRLLILHIVLSHHGKLEFGSPVLPKTPEALVVHVLDDLDGKLESMFRGIREDAGQGNWTAYSRSMDRMIYKPRWPKIP
jgi:3'-5' exoribonuclease